MRIVRMPKAIRAGTEVLSIDWELSRIDLASTSTSGSIMHFKYYILAYRRNMKLLLISGRYSRLVHTGLLRWRVQLYINQG